MTIIDKIKKLNLPAGQYVAVGGASLAARGIRETRDLDIVVYPELFAELSTQDWQLDAEYERKWNRKRLKKDDIEIYPDLFLEKKNEFFDIKELIANADIIEEVAFQRLDNLMICKLDSAREKDLKDVGLIKIYLAKQ